MSGRNVQPSIWYYCLAVLIVIVGFAAFAWSLFSGISSVGSGLVQMTAPGYADLDLKEPGEYTIFYENQSYFNGSFYSTAEQIPGLQIKVSEKSSGRTVATYPASGSVTYSIGGRTGRSIMAFNVEEAGVYQINASYPGGSGPQVVLAIGKGVAEGIFYLVITSIALLFGSIIIAAVISFVTYTRRKKALLSEREEEKIIRGGS